MRDTLLLLLLLAITTITVIVRDRNVTVPRKEIPTPLSPFPKLREREGGKDEKRSRRTHHEDQGEVEGSSTDVATIAKLPSIYETEEGTSVYPIESDTEGDPKEEETSTTLHGLPVKAWIRSQKNWLFLSSSRTPEDQALRVFLWCLELKSKKVDYLGERECRSLALKGPGDGRLGLY